MCRYAARAKLIVCNPKIRKPDPEEEAAAAVVDKGKKNQKKTFDFLPRYLRTDGYLTGQGAPRRSWMTGAEQREKTVMSSSPISPTRV